MTGLYHGWSDEPDTHADFIHGGVPVEDFADEPVRWKKKSKRETPKKKPGCPGNDGGPHIYIWTTEKNFEDLFYKFFGFHKREFRYCAGCGKNAKRGSRYTEKYVNKFKPAGRWSSPENDHAGYSEYRRKWRIQRGFTREFYGNW